MNKQVEDALAQIEETQPALRESLETAKRLVDDSDRLISQHRRELRANLAD